MNINKSAIISEDTIKENMDKSIVDTYIDKNIVMYVFKAEQVCNYFFMIISVLCLIWSFMDDRTNAVLFRLGVNFISLMFWICNMTSLHLCKKHILNSLDNRYPMKAIEKIVLKGEQHGND